jgi:GT2 family glycosyltransferase
VKVPDFLQVHSLAELTDAIAPGESTVVFVPVFNAFDETLQCLSSIDRHSPNGTDVVVIDDGSAGSRIVDLLSSIDLINLRLVLWRREVNLGFIATANQGFEASGRRDLVLVNSDTIVGPGWLVRLEAAARSHNLVATATALSNSGSLVSVPDGVPTRHLPGGHTVDSAAEAVAAGSPRSYPEIPYCIGHLVYIRRSAIDLVGNFDESFSPGYGEEIDFALRCVAAGFKHVCADDVYVFHSQGASFGFGQAAEDQRQRGMHRLVRRYPFFLEWVQEFSADNRSPLAASIATASISLRGLNLLLDARCLRGDAVVGTQRVTESLISALGRNARIGRLGVLVSSGTDNQIIGKLLQPEPIVAEIEVLEEPGLAGIGHEYDLAFRPYQIHGSTEELLSLCRAARRVAFWQLDFIAYDNPFYHRSLNEWRRLRYLTRFAIENADGVAMLSNSVLSDGVRKGLFCGQGPGRRVIYPGTNHLPAGAVDQPPPEAVTDDRFKRYVLCLGTDYTHKNRVFALEVFRVMIDLGYGGSLLLAGPGVKDGSSGKAETALLKHDPQLKSRTVMLEAVSAPARDWILRNAELVICPSLAEGFGLIPFEAAAFGVPCLPSRQGSLDEVLPPDIVCIEQWEASEVARTAMNLVDDPDVRKLQVARLQRRAGDFTWARCAEQIVDFAIEVCGTVPAPRATRLPSAENSAAQSTPPRLISQLDRLATIVDNPTRRWARLARATTIALRPPYRAIKRLAARR